MPECAEVCSRASVHPPRFDAKARSGSLKVGSRQAHLVPYPSRLFARGWGSLKRSRRAQVGERLKPTDCKSVRLLAFGGSNPPLCTRILNESSSCGTHRVRCDCNTGLVYVVGRKDPVRWFGRSKSTRFCDCVDDGFCSVDTAQSLERTGESQVGRGRSGEVGGSNSVVESQPSKLLVAGSIPVSRSRVLVVLSCLEAGPLSSCFFGPM